jgi:glucose/arabinose dehydrogenase
VTGSRRRWPAAAAAVLVALAGCGGRAPTSGTSPGTSRAATPAASATTPPSPAGLATGSPQVLVTGLEVPWGLDFLPDGDALVTERDSARVLRIPVAGGDPTEVTVLEQARPDGEGGLLGLAVSPTHDEDGLVYVYVTTEQDNRVVRFRLDRPEQVESVLTGIPRAAVHNGGRIAFGPDGALYVGTGDAGRPSLAQDPRSLGGKVLRMTPDGEPVAGASSVVFSLGHRNVQGLAFGAGDTVYGVEFGQSRFDEVNRLVEGGNYGWPEVEGPGDGDIARGGRYRPPLVTWRPAEASPSGAALVGDDLYVAALRGRRLWRVPLDGSGAAGRPEPLFEGRYGRLRTVARAPDGSLWVLTSNRDGRGDPSPEDDRIVRVPGR